MLKKKLGDIFSSDTQQTGMPPSADRPPTPVPPPAFLAAGPVDSFSIPPCYTPPLPLGYSLPAVAVPYDPEFGLYGSLGQYRRN
jgi:hypothetical protein